MCLEVNLFQNYQRKTSMSKFSNQDESSIFDPLLYSWRSRVLSVLSLAEIRLWILKAINAPFCIFIYLSFTMQLLKRASEEILKIIFNQQNENVSFCDLANERYGEITLLCRCILFIEG
jgi:hypothetical protein